MYCHLSVASSVVDAESRKSAMIVQNCSDCMVRIGQSQLLQDSNLCAQSLACDINAFEIVPVGNRGVLSLLLTLVACRSFGHVAGAFASCG